MDNAKVFVITQSILAIIVVIGGGVLFYIQPDSREAITGIMGLVIGFFFRESTGAIIAKQTSDIQSQNQRGM